MTFGLVANGDNNNLLFSTDTDNLFFQGKATIYQIYDSLTIDYAAVDGYGVFYNRPSSVFYEYRITMPSSVESISAFVYNPVQKRTSVASIVKLDSTTWEIIVVACTNPNNSQPAISSSTYIPTIYVFSSYIDAVVNTGNGINVFDALGNVVFTTNERPLLIKAAYSGNIQYSNILRLQTESFTYVGNGPSQSNKTISWFNPLNTVSSITKPAVFFSCNQTAARRSIITVNVYEATARFDPSNNQLGIEWASPGQYFSQQDINQQSTVTPFFAFVIDGAQYD